MGEGTGVRGRAGEGSDPRLPPNKAENLLDHPFGIPEHPLVRKPQDREAQTPDVRVPLPVARGGLRLLVNFSVELQHQPNLVAAEIRHEGTERVLPPKLQTSQPAIPKDPPERLLRGSLPLSEIPGQIAHLSSRSFFPRYGTRDGITTQAKGKIRGPPAGYD